MAHIRKRQRSDGSTAWQVRHALDGSEMLRTFDRKSDASRWLADRQAAELRGELLSPEVDLLSVAELAAEWRATWPGRLQPGSQKRADELLRLYVLPSLGGERAATLSYARVAAFLAALPQRLSPSTVRKVHACLSAVFTNGLRLGLVRVNPCARQLLPRIEKVERPIIDGPMAERLADAAGAVGEQRDRVAVRLAFYTGLRAGELWALRSSDVQDGRVVVRRALKLVNGRHEFGPTKTHQARSVSVPASVLADVQLLRDGAADTLLFRGAYGAPIRHNLWLNRVWRPAKREAGLDVRFRFHDLRHSHASVLLSRGVPIHVVRARLGHASITTTVDVYGHLAPGADDDVARLLDAA